PARKCDTWRTYFNSGRAWYDARLMAPTFANGKICYVELPAVCVGRSSEVCQRGFGVETRKGGRGGTAFWHTAGDRRWAWMVGRPAESNPGLMLYSMVDSVARTLEAIAANGGEIVERSAPKAPEVTARFRDPAGNVIGLYQQRS